jgi:hypothetical protein
LLGMFCKLCLQKYVLLRALLFWSPNYFEARPKFSSHPSKHKDQTGSGLKTRST